MEKTTTCLCSAVGWQECSGVDCLFYDGFVITLQLDFWDVLAEHTLYVFMMSKEIYLFASTAK